MSKQDATIDLKQYLRMFWRRRGVIALCAIALVCAAAVGLEFVTEEYEATATISIEDRQRLASQLESVLGGMRETSGGYRAEEKRMEKILSRVHSRPFLEKVTRVLGLHEDPGLLEYARALPQRGPDLTVEEIAIRTVVRRMQQQIRVEGGRGGVYRFVVTDTDPYSAQRLAKWVAELFVDVSQQSSLDELRSAHEFGAEQLKIYEDQLERSERALEQYRASVIEQSLAKRVVRTTNVALAEALYSKVLDEAELARVRILPFARTLDDSGLKSERDGLFADVRLINLTQGLTTALEDELTDRLVSETRASADWPPTGSYVSLRRGLLQSVEQRVDENYAGLGRDQRDALVRYVFSSLDRRAHVDAAQFLGDSILRFKSQARAEPRGEMELARLESEVRTNRELLQSFQAQLVASDVNQAMEMTNLGLRIEILEPPEVPLAPARPDRAKILLMALAMGPVLGAGIAFASELMDPTLRSLEDFQRVFAGPVLGTTPLLTRRALDVPSRLRRHWTAWATLLVVVLTAGFFASRTALSKPAPSPLQQPVAAPAQEGPR